ncbi:MAG: 3,4-dihydroxy-2-butanone-4-phosphate synthase, partial [Planctomycetes bacterium]|nr:3,4-dihydroxy-2-butanone-4-phosphate synthase [Planctomycetota bacterium]
MSNPHQDQPSPQIEPTASAVGSSFAPIEDILDELRAGRMVVICDDEDRENEGDL